MSNSFTLDGKVAIVTGAGGIGNIGAQTARLLAECGARVVLADLDGSALARTTEELTALGLPVARHATDISDERSVESRGSIINISSGTTVAGDFFATAYAASKGAINTLTRYVATQYGDRGIRCNALILGLIETPRLQSVMPPPLRELFREHKLVQRLGSPLDVARMVAFLAAEQSSFITGQLLPVDGGSTPTRLPRSLLASC